jgi:hypothetical protein
MVYEQQLRDVKDIKTQLSNQKDIEIKKIEKANFEPAMRYYAANPGDLVSSFLIESLNSIIQGNPGAKPDLKSPEWSTFAGCQEALRNANIRKMDKSWIRERMEQITGESGIPEQDGEVYKQISDPAKTKNYIHFIPFFKILSKTLHLGMMLKKEEEMQKRVSTNIRSINQMKVKIKVTKSIEGSALHVVLAREANRMRENELKVLKSKKQQLERRRDWIEGHD